MSVVTVKLIHEGRDGADDVTSAGKVTRRYTRVFRITVDDATDTAATIYGSGVVPMLGAPMPGDPTAWLRQRQCTSVGFSKTVWILTCSYSSEYEMAEDPLAEPAKITWRTEQFQIAAAHDVNGYGVVNTAGDPPNPPAMQDDDRWAIMVRKNVPLVPAWINLYRRSTNNAAWLIDGYTVPKGFARLASIEIGDRQERNDVLYRVLTMGFQLKEMDDTTNMFKWDGAAWTALAADEFEHAHAVIKPNVGYHYISSSVRHAALDNEGEPVSQPVQLNEFGNLISNPSPSTMYYTVHDVLRPMNYGALPTI